MRLLCTPKAAAEALGVSERTVWSMLADGRLTRRQVPGVRGSKVLVSELERIVRGTAPRVPAPSPMTDAQRVALNAKCGQIDRQLRQKAGTAKEGIYIWASERFGRPIHSSKGLSWDETHQVLNELQERVEATAG